MRFTGLRPDLQVMNLRREDFDLDQLVLYVGMGKTEEEDAGRFVPISPYLAAEVSSWGRVSASDRFCIFESAGLGLVVGHAASCFDRSGQPAFGLFLNRLNFGLMFGRFALDAEHRSIWFDEMLLGDQLNEEALKFAIQVVASTADEWDDRLKEMFGGLKYREAMGGDQAADVPPVKPGEGPPAGHGQYI